MRLLSLIFVFFMLFYGKIRSQEVGKPNPNIKEIIFVFKTHFDNGYDDLAESVIDKYSTTMMDQALTTLEKSRTLPRENQFVWTLASWPLKSILERCTPAIKPEIEAAIRDGWFVFHALPLTFETEAGDPEALVRSLTFSAELSKKFNLPLPRDAKLTDVPSHSWFLPTMLSNAGIKILHIGCNSASASPAVPLLFWWQGPDGSKLMTFYWGKSYGTTLVPDDNWKYKTWLAIIHTGDNQGPPSPEDVSDVLKKAHELAPNAKLRIGRISDFYDAIIQENPDLPVVMGDMPDTWVHGYMSMPREMKSTRKIQKDIFSFELLNTLTNIWAKKKVDVTRFVNSAAEGALLWDEHTFGMSMKDGLTGDWYYGDEFRKTRAAGTYSELEASWKEKGDRIYQAAKVIEPAYDREIKRIAGMISIAGQRIVVFNPLPWVRSGVVTIQQKNEIEALKNLSTGEIIPVDNQGNILRFIANDIPSSGYSTFIPVKGQKPENVITIIADEKNNTIENEFFKVRFDPAKGSVASVIDKKTGREMVDKNSEFGFGQYIYERFSKNEVSDYYESYVKDKQPWSLSVFGRPNLDDTPYKRINEGKAKVSYSSDAISAKALLEFKESLGNPHNYSVSLSLYRNMPYLELTWFIDGKAADPWPEAGWLSFPFKVENPCFKVGRLGAVADPAKDFVKGSDFDFFLINNGIALHDNQMKGYAISTPDAPGISLDRPGLWKYSGSFIPKRPNVFINLYNNQWSTNFTEWIEGSWSVKIFLWCFSGYRNESALISPNEEFRVPLVAALTSAKPGDSPVSQSGIILSRKGIMVTAYGQNPFGNGTILRLWEQSGDSGRCKITLPSGADYSRAIPVNLRSEKTGNPILIKNHAFEIELGPYKPASFIIEN